jgi:hypothetical protein
MRKPDAKRYLEIALDHLKRVKGAWSTPTDRADLSLYGFYCLEAAIMAAAAYVRVEVKHTHPAKADAARWLNRDYGLPDISETLSKLNTARKGVAYGDVAIPNFDPQQVASDVEAYVEAVANLING